MPVKSGRLICSSKQKDCQSTEWKHAGTFLSMTMKMEKKHTRKMIFKAPIVHILKAECPMYLLNRHYYSIAFATCCLYFIAITKKLYNIFMLDLLEVIKLVSKLLEVKIWITATTKYLYSNIHSMFSHSL